MSQCESLDVAVQGWSPLIQGKFEDEPVFAEIGKKHERSAAQVVIRWALQKGFVTIRSPPTRAASTQTPTSSSLNSKTST